MRPTEPPAPRRWAIETTVKNLKCKSSSPFAPGAVYFGTECRTEIPEYQRICEEHVYHLLAASRAFDSESTSGCPILAGLFLRGWGCFSLTSFFTDLPAVSVRAEKDEACRRRGPRGASHILA